jgi:hypothetical protein
VPDAQGFQPRQLLGFIRATLTHPYWLGGIALSTVGLGLHAFALNGGALAVVQLLMVLGVLFALVRAAAAAPGADPPQRAVVGADAGRRSGRFPPGGHSRRARDNVDRGPAIAAGLLTVGAAAVCVLVARDHPGATAAALLGIATGIAHAGTATLTKACTNLLTHSPATLVTSWQLCAVLAAGAVDLLLNQLSFQAGPLAVRLPAMTVVNPRLSVLLGVVVYDETCATPPGPSRHYPAIRTPTRDNSKECVHCPAALSSAMRSTDAPDLTWLYQRGVAVPL